MLTPMLAANVASELQNDARLLAHDESLYYSCYCLGDDCLYAAVRGASKPSMFQV